MRVTTLIVALLVPTCTAALPPSISLTAGADSCLVISAPPGIGSFGVVVTSDAMPAGCVSLLYAQFRIVGLPQGWLATTTPNPAAVTAIDGDLFGAGATVQFTSLQVGIPLVLFDVTLGPSTPGATAILKVEGLDVPVGPDYCARVGGDCSTYPPSVCAEGGTLYVNGSQCPVGVDLAPWSRAKRLYQ